MKILESKVSYPFPKQLTDRILPPKRIIHLRQRDIDTLFSNRNGTILEVYQEEEDNVTFMQYLVEKLLGQKIILNATSILICFEMSERNPVLMGELVPISDFFSNIRAASCWGASYVDTSSDGEGLKAIVIAM